MHTACGICYLCLLHIEVALARAWTHAMHVELLNLTYGGKVDIQCWSFLNIAIGSAVSAGAVMTTSLPDDNQKHHVQSYPANR